MDVRFTGELGPTDGLVDDTLRHFQEGYAAIALSEGSHTIAPSDDDLVHLREALLKRPDEPEEVSATRQAILDDPDKLRAFFQIVTSRGTAQAAIDRDIHIRIN